MSGLLLFVGLAIVATYIVWCDERDQFELAVRRCHENGQAKWVYVMADELVNGPAMQVFKVALKLEMFCFEPPAPDVAEGA